MSFHRITKLCLLFLLLLIGATGWAQDPSIYNSDGSVYKRDVIQGFNTYLDQIDHQLPERQETQMRMARGYIENVLFPNSNIYIRLDDDGGRTYTEEEYMQNYRDCVDEMAPLVNKKRLQREKESQELLEKNTTQWNWKMIAMIGGIVLLILLFAFLLALKGKKRPSGKSNYSQNDKPVKPTVEPKSENEPGIVVRRKTASIMRKQSLEDVVGNSNYMEIDSSDFCFDSAVRKIYIKNTCIKEIYDMYANDLRNSSSPNEDGCMVLGRWVHDKDNNTYDVSLEDIVYPGDDAIFSEYELNFGGKIKLKVAERLKKLRHETELQYDLTCWVHSHPGLGVFFSNSDCGVQTQLKHPTHPNFLTAIVIDILTSEQDLGIFTFRNDSSINSKSDLKKLYSLEKWYKWATKSESNSFKQEEYYDTLTTAKSHTDTCHSIYLSNNIIIDISLLPLTSNDNLVRIIQGFTNRKADYADHVAEKLSETDATNDNDMIGAFMVAPHCSIPSIRKAISDCLDRIEFVLVYSTSDGNLTSIPVINNDLCTDDSYYGEQQFENLKIWTRRKR